MSEMKGGGRLWQPLLSWSRPWLTLSWTDPHLGSLSSRARVSSSTFIFCLSRNSILSPTQPWSHCGKRGNERGGSVHCILYILQNALYNIQYKIYCILYLLQSTLYSVQCTLYTVQTTIWSLFTAAPWTSALASLRVYCGTVQCVLCVNYTQST